MKCDQQKSLLFIMGSFKKNLQSRHCGLYNLGFGILLLIIPFILLESFFYGYCSLLITVSASTANITQKVFRKNIAPLFSMKQNNEQHRTLPMSKLIVMLLVSIGVYYFFAVMFGAPIFESCIATLYFSCLMSLLTVYPLCCYLWFSEDGAAGIQRMFVDFKYDNLSENHLYTTITWSVIGAWFGAFPIPLDWDRPWQEWPTTCCIGAVLGYAGAHFMTGTTTLWNTYKERKKLSWNLFV